jgi:hypothetical protein
MDCPHSWYAGNREPGSSGQGSARPGIEALSGGSVPRPMEPGQPATVTRAREGRNLLQLRHPKASKVASTLRCLEQAVRYMVGYPS